MAYEYKYDKFGQHYYHVYFHIASSNKDQHFEYDIASGFIEFYKEWKN